MSFSSVRHNVPVVGKISGIIIFCLYSEKTVSVYFYDTINR